jgi:hypothetical protein
LASGLSIADIVQEASHSMRLSSCGAGSRLILPLALNAAAVPAIGAAVPAASPNADALYVGSVGMVGREEGLPVFACTLGHQRHSKR